MKWGVFEDGETIHVAPCNEDGTLAAPHTLDDFCDCGPVAEDVGNNYFLIHWEEQ